jgi:hypothetical protein
VLGVAVEGVAVEGVAVDGAAVDGTAVDGVTVDGVALEGVSVGDGVALHPPRSNRVQMPASPGADVAQVQAGCVAVHACVRVAERVRVRGVALHAMCVHAVVSVPRRTCASMSV